MLTHIKGQVVSRSADHIVVECGGLGYQIIAPVDVTHKVKVKEEVFLYLHHHFILDQTRAQENLYGFLHEQDRALFRKLLTVKGIGPRIGIDILSGCGREALVKAIRSKDTGLLKKFKGIGTKSAERLVVELHSQLDDFDGETTSSLSAEPDQLEDTINALKTLGYKENESRRAAEKVIGDAPKADVATLVRAALQKI
jgi:Holliday junction DNA helicase RuvA